MTTCEDLFNKFMKSTSKEPFIMNKLIYHCEFDESKCHFNGQTVRTTKEDIKKIRILIPPNETSTDIDDDFKCTTYTITK